jgi:hypothetical protein
MREPRDVPGRDCTAETFAALGHAEERDFGESRNRPLLMEAWDQTNGTTPAASDVAQVRHDSNPQILWVAPCLPAVEATGKSSVTLNLETSTYH